LGESEKEVKTTEKKRQKEEGKWVLVIRFPTSMSALVRRPVQ
jgi:hypothetical protein